MEGILPAFPSMCIFSLPATLYMPGPMPGPQEGTWRSPPPGRNAPFYTENHYCGGFKVFIGDLPGWVTPMMVHRWITVQPPQCRHRCVDISVTDGAASGVQKAIVTMETREGAAIVFAFCWAVWTPVPDTVDGRLWRWITVRHHLERPGR